MIAWDGSIATEGKRTRAEMACRAGCPGPRECACPCHDAADRVRALLAERFPGVLA